jgi:chromosome segregation ATPase
MSFREDIRRLGQRFHKEVSELRKEHDAHALRLEEQFDHIERRLARVEVAMQQTTVEVQRLQISLVATNDEFGGLRAEIVTLRRELADGSKNSSGRMRLLEDRFSQMLEAVASSQVDPEVVDDLVRRVELLERQDSSAA